MVLKFNTYSPKHTAKSPHPPTDADAIGEEVRNAPRRRGAGSFNDEVYSAFNQTHCGDLGWKKYAEAIAVGMAAVVASKGASEVWWC